MKKHINIPVFVPHMGCPHACVFCNQKAITGHGVPDFSHVASEIENALKTTDPAKQDIQIAFFGGSFTGIDRGDMIYLLSVAKEFINAGKVGSIRLSTRPDYIDAEIIDILKAYGVKTVELGIQSCSDKVLSACGRGHDSLCSYRASELIVSSGLSLVGQMMIGLPESDEADEIFTAKQIVRLGASAARIYPTVVFSGTELAKMAERGEYLPLSREEAVSRSEAAFGIFAKAGVDVIRIGLQSSESLVSGREIACGDYCEAIGEMCIGRYFEKEISALCVGLDGKNVTVLVHPSRISSAVGYGGENRRKITESFGLHSLKIKPCDGLREFEVRIKTE